MPSNSFENIKSSTIDDFKFISVKILELESPILANQSHKEKLVAYGKLEIEFENVNCKRKNRLHTICPLKSYYLSDNWLHFFKFLKSISNQKMVINQNL